MRNRERRNPGRYRAIAYALLVHAVVIAGLVIGFRWTSPPTTATPENAIEAVVVEDPDKKRLEDERRRTEEERKKAEAERKHQETEAQKKREEERKLDERRKKEESEKQRLAEQKRKQEEEAKQREKAEVEAARKRQQVEAESHRKAAVEEIQKQLEKEEGDRAQAARAARAANELDKYKPLIQQKVKRNWVAAGTAPGLECVVRVRLAPGGEVLQATVVKGSGNPIFDRSVPPAVYKASPLPIPKESDLFEEYREIEFTFKPSQQ